MRLPRTSLLARLTADDVPPVVLLEAPPGYGKSWLARRAAATGDVLRLRGELGRSPTADPGRPTCSLDDAHLLSADDVDVLRERIEDADGRGRLIVAGRLLADAIHEVTQLVDGLIVDSEALAVDRSGDRRGAPPGLADRSPTASSRRPTAASASSPPSLDQAQRDRSSDAVGDRLAHGALPPARPPLHQLDAPRALRRRPARAGAGHRRHHARPARRRRLRRRGGRRRRPAAPPDHRRPRAGGGGSAARDARRPGRRRHAGRRHDPARRPRPGGGQPGARRRWSRAGDRA